MSKMTALVRIASDVSPGGTFTVPYESGFAQADFESAGTSNVSYSGVNTSCAWATGASEITVTWPGGAAGDLAAGNYYIDFDAIGGGLLTDSSGGTASDTIAAIGASYNQDEVRNAVATLAARVNELIAVANAKGDIEA